MLEVEGLSKRLGDFEIRDVTFTVERGDYFVMLGESGTGKTVLLETLTGMMTPDSGRILLNGKDITHERIQDRNAALVFQNHALFPHMTVRQNIAYGPVSNGDGRAEVSERTLQLAARTGVEHLLDRKPDSLSGGEAQRVALARALATEPDCMLLDEPICSLDYGARAAMRRLLRELNAGGMTMVHITHDYEEAAALASRIGVMEQGRLVQVDTPQNILLHPRSEFMARFIGIRNLYRGEITHRSGGTIEFAGDGMRLEVLDTVAEGDGIALFGSDDVTVTVSPPSSSARNVFAGTIVEILPARRGMEVIVDAGCEIAALLTAESVDDLGLSKGSPVYAAVKASAVRVLER